MWRYVVKRILMLIPVIIGVSFIIYFVMDLAPGNVLDVMYPDATAEEMEFLIHEHGYDRSVFYRYGLYMKDLVRGNLGISIATGKPVMDTYMERLPSTIILTLGSITLCHVLSLPLGIYSAVKRGTLWDNGCMVLSIVGLSMPNFWLGLLLIIAFSLHLGLFPSGGFRDGLLSLVLPAITVGTGMMARLTRTTRSSMVDVISSDYLRTARAKGVTEKTIIQKHALKNALIPIITISGSQMAGCIGGAVLTESVFAWPGVGRMIVDAINLRDTTTVTGAIIMTTILSGLILLGVDLLYAVVDPRIKAQYTKGGKKA